MAKQGIYASPSYHALLVWSPSIDNSYVKNQAHLEMITKGVHFAMWIIITDFLDDLIEGNMSFNWERLIERMQD